MESYTYKMCTFVKHLIVYGLENTADSRAQALAFDLARKWLNNNYLAYQQSIPSAMFEKVQKQLQNRRRSKIRILFS